MYSGFLDYEVLRIEDRIVRSVLILEFRETEIQSLGQSLISFDLVWNLFGYRYLFVSFSYYPWLERSGISIGQP